MHASARAFARANSFRKRPMSAPLVCTYSRSAIRLAREAMGVPNPPKSTPIRSECQLPVNPASSTAESAINANNLFINVLLVPSKDTRANYICIRETSQKLLFLIFPDFMQKSPILVNVRNLSTFLTILIQCTNNFIHIFLSIHNWWRIYDVDL